MSDRWEEINRIYDTALEVGEAERPAFVREACQGDEELLREVESLLAAHEQAGSFAESPAFARLTPSAAGGVTRMLDGEGVFLKNGDRLGSYQIAEFLEAGGMGEVYRALDINLGRHVAIKILPRAFTCDSERLARFEREACVLASLSHQNIETIHAIEDRDGVRALVLELVEGKLDRPLKGLERVAHKGSNMSFGYRR